MKKIVIYTDGFEGARKRSLERAKKLDRGEVLEPETSVTLGSSAIEALSPARIQLFQEVKKQKSPVTIAFLAEHLHRSRESVSRDVNKLKACGFLRVQDVSNPGHGRVTMVAPVARKVMVAL